MDRFRSYFVSILNLKPYLPLDTHTLPPSLSLQYPAEALFPFYVVYV